MVVTTGRQRLTIGAVCEALKAEFPDVSISKIRYLEGEGLLTPKRTEGGYRLFTEEDLERLRTILRLQRDEFLPLRVIREELAAGAAKERRRRTAAALGEHDEDALDLDDLCERAGVTRVLSATSTAPAKGTAKCAASMTCEFPIFNSA